MTEHMSDCRQAVSDYVTAFQALTPASLAELDRYFAPDIRFKDPFNDVSGRAAVRRIFEHMFKTTDMPRFSMEGWMCEADMASIRWRFRCNLQGIAIDFPGMSLVRFNGQGEVVEHVDYWDPAEGIYERLPLLGSLMRFIRRRLAITDAR